MKPLILALLASAVLVPTAGAAPASCLSVSTSSAQLRKGAPAKSFSATKILDVDLAVVFPKAAWKNYSGTHVLRLELFSPSGHHYETLNAPFSADDSKKGSAIRLPGYPRPVPFAPNQSVAGVPQVSVRLPVAGTDIVAAGLYGTWSAQIWVDGARADCGAAQDFTITP